MIREERLLKVLRAPHVSEKASTAMEKSNTIVLKTFNNCRDTVFVAFEVNNTVSLLVATTDMTSGDTAIVVTTTGFAVFFQQRSKRFALVQLRVNHFNYVATTRRCRFTFNNCHCITPPTYSAPPTKSRFWPSFRVT